MNIWGEGIKFSAENLRDARLAQEEMARQFDKDARRHSDQIAAETIKRATEEAAKDGERFFRAREEQSFIQNAGYNFGTVLCQTYFTVNGGAPIPAPLVKGKS